MKLNSLILSWTAAGDASLVPVGPPGWTCVGALITGTVLWFWLYFPWASYHVRAFGSLRWSDGATLVGSCCYFRAYFLSDKFITETATNVFPLDYCLFFRSIFVYKFLNAHIATSNSDQDFLTFFNFDVHSFWTKLIDTFRFSQKHDAHLFAFWVLIDEVTKSHIYLIRPMCYINALWTLLHFTQ